MRTIKKGEYIAITKGEYSDYCLVDHLRAERDFSPSVEAERFKLEGDFKVPPNYDPDGEPEEWDSEVRFLAWMIREGIVTTVENVVELHVGCYGKLDLWMRDEVQS